MDYKKEEMKETILQSSVIGITPKIVDTNVLYVNIQIDATYNKLYLKMTPTVLSDNIIETTHSFFNNSVSSFNVDFKYIKILALKIKM